MLAASPLEKSMHWLVDGYNVIRHIALDPKSLDRLSTIVDIPAFLDTSVDPE